MQQAHHSRIGNVGIVSAIDDDYSEDFYDFAVHGYLFHSSLNLGNFTC